MKLAITYFTVFCFFTSTVMAPIGAIAQTGTVPEGYTQIRKNFPIRFSDMQSTYKGVHKVLQVALEKSMYKNCVSAGGTSDNRTVEKKYFCPEWPLGTTSPVIHPDTGATLSVDASQVQVSLEATQKKIDTLTSTNAPEATLASQRRFLSIFDRALRNWKSNKVLFEEPVSIYDMSNNERELVFQVKAPRITGGSSVREGVLIGGATGEEREVNHFTGKQTVKTYIVSGNLYQEICFTHPKVVVGGANDRRREGYPVNETDYTLQQGIFRDTVHLSFTPGTMTASSVEFCALVRITAATPNPGKIELVAVDSPKFVDAKISGLDANVTGISFWTSLVAFLLGSIAALIGFFKTGDFRLLLLSPILLLGAGLQAALPFGIFNLLQFVANKMIDKALNNVSREGEGYLRDGTYLKDIAVAGTTTVGANAVANAIENLKQERTMTAHMDPKAALSAQCLSLGKMATGEQKLLSILKNQCYSIGISLKEDSDSKGRGCYDQAYLVQADSAHESLKQCKFNLEVVATVSTVFEDLISCIGDVQFEKQESISSCLPLMSEYVMELKNKLDASRLGIQDTDMTLASSAQAITLMRNNSALFNEVEKYLKGLKGANYDPHEDVEYLKQPANKQITMAAFKAQAFRDSGVEQQLLEAFNKYYRRAPLETEKNSFVGLLSTNTFTQAVNVLINRAKSEFSYALYGVSVQVSGSGATSTEVGNWYNKLISGTMNKDEILVAYRSELAFSQRTKYVITSAYKKKFGAEIDQATLDYHLGRLSRGEVKMARLKTELGI